MMDRRSFLKAFATVVGTAAAGACTAGPLLGALCPTNPEIPKLNSLGYQRINSYLTMVWGRNNSGTVTIPVLGEILSVQSAPAFENRPPVLVDIDNYNHSVTFHGDALWLAVVRHDSVEHHSNTLSISRDRDAANHLKSFISGMVGNQS